MASHGAQGGAQEPHSLEWALLKGSAAHQFRSGKLPLDRVPALPFVTGGNHMADESRSSKAQSTGDTVQYLIIVAGHETDLWGYMTQHYGEFKGVQVLLDRRQRGRRRQNQPYEPERRRAERRHPPTVDDDLCHQSFVIITQQPGALQG